MAIRGVLFDFSSTLFRLEPDVSWLADTGLDGHELAKVVVQLTLAPSEHLPDDLKDDWDRRDVDPETHRRVYLAAYRAAGLDARPGFAERFYDGMLVEDSWRPYPDTAEALRLVQSAGLPVGVLSNIAWDIRPTFARHGLTPDAYVLSFEEGLVKPDPKLFALACERIGVAPEQVLMVGDNEEADGGATAIGCRFAHVPPLGPDERPDALVAALTAHGLAG